MLVGNVCGCDHPDVDFDDLSRDDAYLYRMRYAIVPGIIDKDFLTQKARWQDV